MVEAEWHVLTGEYPPRPGGVSDYTALLSRSLAAVGVAVHVWTPSALDAPAVSDPGVTVHPTRFDTASGLRALGSALDQFSPPRSVLVQYTPYGWGRRGTNHAFARWLVGRARGGDRVRSMIHEPYYPWRLRDRPQRWLLSAIQRRMLRSILAASAAVDVAIPAWGPCLRPYDRDWSRAYRWGPVPSNISVIVDPAEVGRERRRVAPGGETVIGAFSTFGPLLAPGHRLIWPSLLGRRPDRVGLLIGRGASVFIADLEARHPELRGRMVAADDQTSARVSILLQACDVLALPFPDGLSTRRTTLMAGLAHGCPIASNRGFLSEPFWAEADAVLLADSPAGVGDAVERLLNDPDAAAAHGRAAKLLYAERFAVEHAVAALQDGWPADRGHGPDVCLARLSGGTGS
jgi:glycosyltransferase involved in cell wall biosynthesis